MKIYYIENLVSTTFNARLPWIEQIYLIDTGFNLVSYCSSEGDNFFNQFKEEGTWGSIEEFKKCWKDFDKDAIMVRVL